MCGSFRLWSLAESNHLPPPSAKTGGDVTAVKIVMWEETRQSLQEKIYREPIAGWEGPSVLSLGEAIWSSLVYLQDNYTQEKKEAYLVLFSFHLLILEADHATNRFIYQGTLPLSGMSVEEVRKDNVVNMFTVSCPMVDARIVICTSASELQVWLQKTEERIQKTSNQQSSITHSVLSYLLPCNEKWKKQELKRYLLHSPIENWEGSAIQHLGEIVYLSLVQISSFKGEFKWLPEAALECGVNPGCRRTKNWGGSVKNHKSFNLRSKDKRSE
ncbi:ARHG7 factor, partial [Polypterus senegalus]